MRWQKNLVYVLVIGLCATSPLVHAATAQVGVTAFASDTPSGVPYVKHEAGSPATGSAVASRMVTAIAGNSSSHAEAEANALSGAIKEKVSASVVAGQYVIGRNAGASSVASMIGSINLVGPALPGMATFTAVLEGSYSVLTPAPFNYPSIDNHVRMQYAFHVGGSSATFQDDLQYFCCSPGTFSIPFSWTQVVQAGDTIQFYLYLKTDVFSVAGVSQFDASNTFKITGVDLPQGYTFTSDTEGFLSQFGSPVPEPDTPLQFGLGLILVAVAVARRQWLNSRPPQ